MLDAATAPLIARPAPALPVDRLVIGKPVDEVAALLPRLFNLCRAAQAQAVRAALGMPPTGDEVAGEILRDHVLRLTLVLPRHFGHPPLSLPSGWQAGGTALRRALFGPSGQMPNEWEAFSAWCAAGQGLAGTFAKIGGLFGEGEAVADGLPLVVPETALDPGAAVENSPAGRRSDHPLMRSLEARTGRGPLWRAVGRAVDLQAVLDGHVPAMPADPGTAHVAATRGLYSVRATQADGRVTAFARVTPTDHLTAPGGVLERSLAHLSAHRGSLAPLLLDILDPCAPVRLEAADA